MDNLETEKLVDKMITLPSLREMLKKFVRGDASAASHFEATARVQLDAEPSLDYPADKTHNARRKMVQCTGCKKWFNTHGLIPICRECKP